MGVSDPSPQTEFALSSAPNTPHMAQNAVDSAQAPRQKTCRGSSQSLMDSYSTVFLTRALPHYGQIDTLELDPSHAAVASETFLDADLFPFPKIHIGPALETLKNLSPPGSAEKMPEAGYDLVFIDADKETTLEYFQESLRLTRKGGVIVVDNAVRRGRVAREQQDGAQDVGGMRRLYDWVEADKGKSVLASGIQTVGAKSWE